MKSRLSDFFKELFAKKKRKKKPPVTKQEQISELLEEIEILLTEGEKKIAAIKKESQEEIDDIENFLSREIATRRRKILVIKKSRKFDPDKLLPK